MDRHVVTKQKPRPIKQILKDIKAKLEKETLPIERDYLLKMISYYEGRKAGDVKMVKPITSAGEPSRMKCRGL